jgi:hypothetical protein
VSSHSQIALFSRFDAAASHRDGSVTHADLQFWQWGDEATWRRHAGTATLGTFFAQPMREGATTLADRPIGFGAWPSTGRLEGMFKMPNGPTMARRGQPREGRLSGLPGCPCSTIMGMDHPAGSLASREECLQWRWKSGREHRYWA